VVEVEHRASLGNMRGSSVLTQSTSERFFSQYRLRVAWKLHPPGVAGCMKWTRQLEFPGTGMMLSKPCMKVREQKGDGSKTQNESRLGARSFALGSVQSPQQKPFPLSYRWPDKGKLRTEDS
jgi:hypothetical protein